MPNADTVAAVDIGGTKTAAALVDRAGRLVDSVAAATPGRDGAQAVLDTVAELVAVLVGRQQGPAPAALGIGSAGMVDPVSGRVLGATDTLAGWAGTDLRGGVAERTGLPVTVVNDVHAHALGEAAYGVAAGLDSFLFVAVGTGVGGALVLRGLDGRVLTGAHAAAGHVGHVPSRHAVELPCSCGGRGHLESIASGPALVREYERRTSSRVVDLREVVTRAAAGDREAGDVLALGGSAVGATVGGLVNVLDPVAVVVGGGVVGAGQGWWRALVAGASAELLPSLRDVPLLPSALGADAALLGAASLAWRLAGGGV